MLRGGLLILLIVMISSKINAETDFGIYQIRTLGYEQTFTSVVYKSANQLFVDQDTLDSLPLKHDLNLIPRAIAGCNPCFNLEEIGTYTIDDRSLKINLWLSPLVVTQDTTELANYSKFNITPGEQAHIFNYTLGWGKRSVSADLNYVTGFDVFSSDIGINFSRTEGTSEVSYGRALLRYDFADQFLSAKLGKQSLNYGNVFASAPIIGLVFNNNPSYRPTSDFFANTTYQTIVEGGGHIQISSNQYNLVDKNIASSLFEVAGLPSSAIQSFDVHITDNKGNYRTEIIETVDLTGMLAEGNSWWNIGLGALNDKDFSMNGAAAGGFYRSGLASSLNIETGGMWFADGTEAYFLVDYSTPFGRFFPSVQYQDVYNNINKVLLANYRLSLSDLSLDMSIPIGDKQWRGLLPSSTSLKLHPKIKLNYNLPKGELWYQGWRMIASYEQRDIDDSWSLSLAKTFNNNLSVNLFSTYVDDDYQVNLSLNMPLDTSFDGNTRINTSLSDNGFQQSGVSYSNDELSANVAYFHDRDGFSTRIENSWQQIKGNFSAIYDDGKTNAAGTLSGAIAYADGEFGLLGRATESVAVVRTNTSEDVNFDVEVNQTRYPLSQGSVMIPVSSFGQTKVRYLPNGEQLIRLSKLSDTVSIGKGVSTDLALTFESSGLLIYFNDIYEQGTLNIAGKEFTYYKDIGAYITDIPVGNHLATLTTEQGKNCQAQAIVGIEFSELFADCNAETDSSAPILIANNSSSSLLTETPQSAVPIETTQLNATAEPAGSPKDLSAKLNDFMRLILAQTAAPANRYTIQFGAYLQQHEAQEKAEEVNYLLSAPIVSLIKGEKQPIYRVRFGNFASLAQAKAFAERYLAKSVNFFVRPLTSAELANDTGILAGQYVIQYAAVTQEASLLPLIRKYRSQAPLYIAQKYVNEQLYYCLISKGFVDVASAQQSAQKTSVNHWVIDAHQYSHIVAVK